MLLAGPPCGLFIFLSSSYHRRSVDFPYGNQDLPKIRASNQLVINLLVLLAIAHSRRLFILFLESLNLEFFFLWWSRVSPKHQTKKIKHPWAICAGTEVGATCIFYAVDLSRTTSVSGCDFGEAYPHLDETFPACIAQTNCSFWKHEQFFAESFAWWVVQSLGRTLDQHVGDETGYQTWNSQTHDQQKVFWLTRVSIFFECGLTSICLGKSLGQWNPNTKMKIIMFLWCSGIFAQLAVFEHRKNTRKPRKCTTRNTYQKVNVDYKWLVRKISGRVVCIRPNSVWLWLICGRRRRNNAILHFIESLFIWQFVECYFFYQQHFQRNLGKKYKYLFPFLFWKTLVCSFWFGDVSCTKHVFFPIKNPKHKESGRVTDALDRTIGVLLGTIAVLDDWSVRPCERKKCNPQCKRSIPFQKKNQTWKRQIRFWHFWFLRR